MWYGALAVSSVCDTPHTLSTKYSLLAECCGKAGPAVKIIIPHTTGAHVPATAPMAEAKPFLEVTKQYSGKSFIVFVIKCFTTLF